MATRRRALPAAGLVLVLLLCGVPVAAQNTKDAAVSEGDDRPWPVRDAFERYLGPRQRLGILVSGGSSADFWRVSFEEEGPFNGTTAEVSRDPFLLVVGGLDIYNLFGYIDWNLTYRADNVDGALDLRNADVATGPGRGNVDLQSTLQIPLGYLGTGLGVLGVLGADPQQVYWLNFLRFQWVPIERSFRWEFRLNDGYAGYIDADGTEQTAAGPVLFPARYSERRYGVVVGTWPLRPGDGIPDDPDDPNAIFAASTVELSYMTMRFISPMQFEVSEYDAATGLDGATIATRQFVTTNLARGTYARVTMGDPDILLQWFPDAWGFELWGELFRGRTSLETGAFTLSASDASSTAPGTSDRLVASRFGFGMGFYRQYVFGPRENGRLRWEINGFWQRYSYGPASFGSVDGAFNDWKTTLTGDLAAAAAGDEVVASFFREESFWGVSAALSIGF